MGGVNGEEGFGFVVLVGGLREGEGGNNWRRVVMEVGVRGRMQGKGRGKWVHGQLV